MEGKGHSDKLRGLAPHQLQRLKAVLETRKRVGDELVAQTLVGLGIKRLYTVSGSPIDGILKATTASGIDVFGTRTQFGASVMSGIDNFITGELVSAVCVSSGPAVTNCATGVHVAQVNHRPLLVLGSRRGFPGETGAFQDVRLVEHMDPITKWSAEVASAEDIVPMIRKAGHAAMDGVPGPVYLEFPEGVLFEKGLAVPASSFQEPRIPAMDSDTISIDPAVGLIKAAERPLLCFAEDLRWNGDPEVLLELVDECKLPFITTPMGRGLVSDDHPHCLNRIRRKVLQHTDTFVLVGGALDWRFRFGRDLPRDCRILQVGSNPDQLGINRTSNWQACMSPLDFARLLTARLGGSLDGMAGWTEVVREFSSIRGKPYADSYVSPPGFVDPDAFMQGLGERLPEDAIVVIDGSICLSLANHILRVKRPFSWFDPGLNGCIGLGIPQAVGAALAAPGRPVVAIIGDTGFGMSGFELETASRYGLPIKVVVFNNSGITGSHRDRKIFGDVEGKSIGSFQKGLRYDQIAQALGMEVASSENTATALDDYDSLYAAPGPTCLNLMVDPAFPVPDIW